MSSNRVRFGLKKAYYAPVTLTGDTPTFETPKQLKGAVSIAMEPQGESYEFYADDGVHYETNGNTGYDGTLELAMIPEDFETDCLGQTVDADGLIVETAEDEAGYFALLFEFTGDDHAIRHCMYYCKATRPNVDADTKGEAIEVKTEELSIRARPLPGSKIVKAKTSDSVDATRYEGWYGEVALPDFPELTVSPESATWDGESNVVLTVTGGTVDSIRLNGQTVNTSNYTVSGTTVTLKATYLEGLTPGRKRFKLAAGSEKNVAFVLTIED